MSTSIPAKRKQYPFDQFEPKWQAEWDRCNSFHTPNPGEPGFDPSRPKYYVLDMFPYPSGAGLHVGHPEGYTATDIIARAKRMQGFNVLHPMGWDAFGLPAEQYAIKTGQHPADTTAQNVARFKGQLKRIGFSYDWNREVNTTDPRYFKWTQWIFLKLYHSWFDPNLQKARPISELIEKRKSEFPLEPEASLRAFIDSRRLAYVSEAPVNWCPALGTVLANEEVIDGKSEVGGHPVERRPLKQWMLRITAYAERLIRELDGLDWPESIKLLQRNWIGRSEGAEVDFSVENTGETIRVFTTRPDTLFGATYMVLAPENPLVDSITTPNRREAVETYRSDASRKSDLERTQLAKIKTGVDTGAFAINPVNNRKIPVWIADYVVMGYGTGAIMAVPAHDERDFEFAKTYNLPVIEVVRPAQPGFPQDDASVSLFSGEGIAVNSGFLDGLPTALAKTKIREWLEENHLGTGTVNYKLRDWLFSRQRYWGEPFPIIWKDGFHQGIDESELPLLPPQMDDFKPTGTPEPPLTKATDWVNFIHQSPDGTSGPAIRETNTMPQWAGSCWYYLRYLDPANDTRFVGCEAESYWMGGGSTKGGVDLYVGGTEHAVLHLLYARFWHKVLFDLGELSTPEPFQKLVNQGIILGEDGQKMSKSRGNVVNPDDVISEYGADAFRLYEMFMGPLEQMKPWSMAGVEGVYRFLARVWRLVMEEEQDGSWRLTPAIQPVPMDNAQLRVVHATIKKVTQDIELLSFNTAISQMMVYVNTFTGTNPRPLEAIQTLLILLNPFAPHLTEELWSKLNLNGTVAGQTWPTWDEACLVVDEIEIVLQINGKVRDRMIVQKSATREEIEALALTSEKVRSLIGEAQIRKVIVVPGKLVNIVVG